LFIDYVYFSGKQSVQTLVITYFLVSVKIAECMGPYCERNY